MKGYEARVFQDWTRWDRNTVNIAVRDPNGAMLMPDGTWKVLEPGVYASGDEPIGIELPAAAVEAVAVALQEFQGHASHADTEAKVLREWLAVERGRVDKALER